MGGVGVRVGPYLEVGLAAVDGLLHLLHRRTALGDVTLRLPRVRARVRVRGRLSVRLRLRARVSVRLRARVGLG